MRVKADTNTVNGKIEIKLTGFGYKSESDMTREIVKLFIEKGYFNIEVIN